MHPTLEIKGTKSSRLSGKKIVIGVTGSIASVETLKLCRELVRHGADIYPVMSHSACQIITPDALHFAAGREPVTRIDGRVQHVEFFSAKDGADLYIISPCTANTISKIACGIDDTPVTTCATTAIGAGVPVLIVPAMDLSMWNHPMVRKNISALQKIGIKFIGPVIEEKKAKIVHFERIVAEVIRLAGKRDYAGKSVLVIAGSTEEPIDDTRVISNRSSGETGVQNALAAYERGADVELWMGRCEVQLQDYIPTVRFKSTSDLLRLVKKMKKYDVVLMPAAVSDYTVKKRDGKIPSGLKDTQLTLLRTPKILPEIRKRNKKAFIAGSKLESGTGEQALVDKAKARMKEYDIDMIVANDLASVTSGRNKVIILTTRGGTFKCEGSKGAIADIILDKIIEN